MFGREDLYSRGALSLKSFQTRLLLVLSYAIPVNTSTLSLSTDQKLADYAARYTIRQKLKKINRHTPVRKMRKIMPESIGGYTYLTDRAA